MWRPPVFYLGPLLFLIFINDLPSLRSFYAIKSEDTNVMCLENRINADLANLDEWLTASRRSLNTIKCE